MSNPPYTLPACCHAASVSQAQGHLPEGSETGTHLHVAARSTLAPDCIQSSSAGQSEGDVQYDEWNDALYGHPYAVETRMYEREQEARELEQNQGRQFKRLELSANVIARRGNFDGPDMFFGSQGSIEKIAQSNLSEAYRLTIGTCGQLAPGWVLEPCHDHPVWVIHCPDLGQSHIEGCCFFGGLANNTMSSINYTRENGTIGISFLTWGLGKHDRLGARLDGELLESLVQAERLGGEILIAFVGQNSCTVVVQPIPAGLVDFINSYETIFARSRDTDSEIGQLRLRDAEASISDEMANSFRPLELLRVIRWPAAV